MFSRQTIAPLAAAAFLIWVCAMSGSCARAPETRVIYGQALGTFYTVTVVAPPAEMTEDALRREIDGALDRVNQLMSTYREDSELSRFNRHDTTPFPLSAETRLVFEMAQRIAEESDGAFDVTVGPLVNAWGFGPEELRAPPSPERIAQLLARVGYQKLRLHDDGSISKDHPEVYCDLSGIAKGYAVDAVAEALEARAVTRYMVEVGGEIRVAGDNPQGQPWALGIETPRPDARELHTVVRMRSGALATSGDYRNMQEVDGRMVSHTIAPDTGYPVAHSLASASVIHDSCAMADGYATALMALGPDAAHAFAMEHGLAVMLIVRDDEEGAFKTIITPPFQKHVAQT